MCPFRIFHTTRTATLSEQRATMMLWPMNGRRDHNLVEQIVFGEDGTLAVQTPPENIEPAPTNHTVSGCVGSTAAIQTNSGVKKKLDPIDPSHTVMCICGQLAAVCLHQGSDKHCGRCDDLQAAQCQRLRPAPTPRLPVWDGDPAACPIEFATPSGSN